MIIQRAVFLCAVAGLGACGSTPPHSLAKYTPPGLSEPAAIISVGLTGRAWSIDGAATPSIARTLRLSPGEHRVGINCLSFEVLPAGILVGALGASSIAVFDYRSKLNFALVTGVFEDGKTYYERCATVGGEPRAWISSSPDGTDVPENFSLICTRGCAR
jgi:hypothetical protein